MSDTLYSMSDNHSTPVWGKTQSARALTNALPPKSVGGKYCDPLPPNFNVGVCVAEFDPTCANYAPTKY